MSKQHSGRGWGCKAPGIGSSTFGFTALYAADSANIEPASDEGDESGSLMVTWQIDQDSSDNKGM